MEGRQRGLKVLFAASECVPFVKTGGLADVAGALPRELAARDMDIRVIMPEYRAIKERYAARLTRMCQFDITLGWRTQSCGIDMLEENGVIHYFVDNDFYFGRDYIYGSFTTDEGERFAFLSKAMLEAMERLGFYPDILHLNDWQTGMAAALLKLQYAAREGYSRIKALFTIHNLSYQGVFDRGFMDELMTLGPPAFDPNALEYRGFVNFLKAGLVYADRLSTVSPNYSREIQSAYYGEGMDGVLRERSADLSGILNGIDTESFNPQCDRAIAAPYSASEPSPKALCKAALQRELGLEETPDVPLLAIVSRLTSQKGFDLVERVITEIMDMGVQLAVLGKGEARYEELFTWIGWRYGKNAAVRLAYDDALARRIYAGADMFLMPSKFEPCGLSQLIAMRYGAIPVVRETGGLSDTVAAYNRFDDSGTGFSFVNYNAHELLYTVQRAVKYYKNDPVLWARLVGRAMAADFSWERSANEYQALYRRMMDG